jgi:hypothetical protein
MYFVFLIYSLLAYDPTNSVSLSLVASPSPIFHAATTGEIFQIPTATTFVSPTGTSSSPSSRNSGVPIQGLGFVALLILGICCRLSL